MMFMPTKFRRWDSLNQGYDVVFLFEDVLIVLDLTESDEKYLGMRDYVEVKRFAVEIDSDN